MGPSSESEVVLAGHAPAFRDLMARIREVALQDPVLLEGAPGSGKRTVARWLHAQRGRGPFVEVAARKGKLPASAGTVYVTGLERLEHRSATALRQALRACTAAVVLATSESAEQLREQRFCVRAMLEEMEPCVVRVPSLVERREDISLLATSFLDAAAGAGGHDGFTLEGLISLHLLPWPGNLTELRRTVEGAFAAAGGRQIGRAQLLASGGPHVTGHARCEHGELATALDVLPFEDEVRRILAHALHAAGGHVATAAKLLGIGRATLYRKVREFGLHGCANSR